jgi:hypothetical protein
MKRMMTAVMCLLLTSIFTAHHVNGQTVLQAGDLAITGFNMDNPDEFSIVFMVAIESGTEIRFTDNGWKADNTFRTGEGVYIWTAEQDYTAGAEIIIVPTAMSLASDGDQILVYQGDEDNPQFIAAVNDEGEHLWQDDATNANTSALPSGLTDGYTCVALNETDNLIYNRTDTIGSRDELLNAINAYGSWDGSNSVRQTLSTAGYVISGMGAMTPVRLRFISINNGYPPVVNLPFEVVIHSEDSTGQARPVSQNTVVMLQKVTGSGVLYGTLTDTIPEGSCAVTFCGISYDVAENGLTITAVVVTGDELASDTSAVVEVVTLPDIVINEIYYNGPETGNDTSEFIELFNHDSGTIALDGYSFDQGVNFVFPAGSMIASGEYIVIAGQADLYSGQGYQVFQWDSGTLANTGETVELLDPMDHQIDVVTYDNGPDWGNSAPDGYGPSLELKNPADDNSLSCNWRASYSDGGSPGVANGSPPGTAVWMGGYPGQENNWAVPSNWFSQMSAGPETDVSLPAQVNAMLVVDNAFSCHDMSLDPRARLTVKAGMMLTVTGDMAIRADENATASLVLEDNAAQVFVEGNTVVQQYITGGTSRDPDNAVYHYVSSPVHGVKAGDVFPGTAYVRSYNELTQLWENLTASDSLAVMNGYSVWLGEGDTLVSFPGPLNAGSLSIDGLTYTPPGIPQYNPDYAGYHLIGNPYPSYINWDHPETVKTNIDDAVYFWNPDLQGYSSYIDGIGNNPETTDSIIPPMQGFFVRVSQTGITGSLSMKNDIRLHSDHGYYKNDDSNVLRLTMMDNINRDQTTIRFKPFSTSYFDSGFDAFKLFGNTGVPQIWSRGDDDAMMSINTLPSIEDNGLVPVGCKCDFSGMYAIQVEGVESFDPEISIALEDLRENVTIDCRLQSTYEFDYQTGEPENRFMVQFLPASVIEETADHPIQIYYAGGYLHFITLFPQPIREVTVSDPVGKIILMRSSVNSGSLPLPAVMIPGVYIIRVVADRSVYTQKIVVDQVIY